MTVLLAVVSDTHCGSYFGLCPPSIWLDWGGQYRALRRSQTWLWRSWQAYWQRIHEMREEHQAELWVVLNGDLVEGDHHNTGEIISRNWLHHRKIALEALEPYLRPARHLFVTKGTESHVGMSGLWDDVIAEDLGAHPDEESGTAAWAWLELEAEGVSFAFAHHGRESGREHLRGTGARSLASDLESYYLRKHGRPPPQVGVFSHAHRKGDSGDNFEIRVYVTPCWQMSTSHGHKIRPGRPPDIGGLYFLIKDGQILNRDVWLEYKPRRPKAWQATR